MIDRRKFLQAGAATVAGTALMGCSSNEPASKTTETPANVRHNPIGVSTYSFWQFNRPKNDPPIEEIIDHVAAMGFDGVELLLVQMASDDTSYLNMLKKRASTMDLTLWVSQPIRDLSDLTRPTAMRILL